MASILKPWLWPEIEPALDRVLQWKAGVLGVSQSEIEDDDSNLRIPIPTNTRSNSCVQIVKFLTFQHSVQVVLSDTQTSISATISSRAVEIFGEKYKKRVTDGTQGGIIQLLHFEVVATHHGPKPDQLTLRIQDFKPLGSDGSGVFGNPKPIEQRNRVQEFLEELKTLRGQPTTKRSVGDNGLLGESFQSQESDNESECSETIINPAEIATQQPRRKMNNGSLDRSRKMAQKDNNTSAIPVNNAGSYLHFLTKMQAESCQDDPMVNNQPKSITTMSPSSSSSNRAIASLQSKAKAANTPAQLVTLIQQHWNKTKRNVNLERKGDAKLQNKSTTPPSSTPAKSVSAGLTTALEVESIIDKAVLSAHLSLEEPCPVLSASNLGDHLSPNTSKDVINILHDENDSEPVYIALQEDPWQGTSRIRRKDVLISKNQQTLLDRKDCWIPSEPGSRGPTANLPLSILQSFTATVEGHVVQTDVANDVDEHSEKQSDSPSRSISPKVNTRHSSLQLDTQEVPLSPAEWPSSSPPAVPTHDELPPDSSIEVSPSPNEDTSEKNAQLGTTAVGLATCKFTLHGDRESLVDSNKQVATEGKLGISDQLLPQDDSSIASITTAHNRENDVPRNSSVVKHEDGHLSHEDEAKSPQIENFKEISGFPGELVEVQNSPAPAIPSNSVHEAFNQANNGQDQMASMKSDMNSDDGLTVPHHAQAHRSRSASNSPEASHFVSIPKSKQQDRNTANLDSVSAPSSQSDLETAAPNALQNQSGIVDKDLPHATPTSGFQIRIPTLQVDRTPYTNGSRKRRRTSGLINMITKYAANGAAKFNKRKRTYSISDDDSQGEDLIPGTFSEPKEPGSSDTERSRQMPTLTPDKTTYNNRAYSSPDIDRDERKPEVQSSKSTLSRAGTTSGATSKREIEDEPSIFRSITKRRKRSRLPEVYFREDDQPLEDPSIRDRQLRRDFLNQQKALTKTTALLPASGFPEDISEDHGIRPAPSVTLSNNQINAGKGASSRIQSTGTQTPEPAPPRKPPSRQGRQTGKSRREVSADHETTDLTSASPAQLGPKLMQLVIFDSFRNAYPTYHGNKTHFVAMCKKINALEVEHRMEHKSLWDDFIIRHQMEYRRYLLDCTEQAEDPMPYEKFYRSEIDEPLFNKRIISPVNIASAITLGLPTVEGCHNLPADPKSISPADHNTVSPLPQHVSQSLPLSLHTTKSASPDLSTPPSRKRPRSLPWKSQTSDNALPTKSSPSRGPSKAVKGTTYSGQKPDNMIPVKNTTSTSKFKPGSAPLKPDTNPLSIPEMNKVSDPLPPGSSAASTPWYLDPVNPFRSFARADAAIRSGSGNGFVEEKDKQKVRSKGIVIKDGVVLAKKRKINVLSWEL
ncbi:hypothetical protein MMC13_000584 [Lambiella insularis]|nr:hypothetical protein [Lambiella insularis]